MKRFTSLLFTFLLLFVFSGFLYSCGKDNDDDNGGNEQKEKVTLTVWGAENDQALLKEMCNEFAKANPLFSKLMISNSNGQLVPTPAVGVVNVRDTATVMEYLNMRKVKEVLPRELAFRWTVKPIDEKGLYYELAR